MHFNSVNHRAGAVAACGFAGQMPENQQQGFSK
jgi:hypothetical protein